MYIWFGLTTLEYLPSLNQYSLYQTLALTKIFVETHISTARMFIPPVWPTPSSAVTHDSRRCCWIATGVDLTAERVVAVCFPMYLHWTKIPKWQQWSIMNDLCSTVTESRRLLNRHAPPRLFYFWRVFVDVIPPTFLVKGRQPCAGKI